MITIDFETYSEAGYLYDPASGHFRPLQKGKPGIRGINAAVYAEHPSTRVISLAYEDKLWVPGCQLPVDLFTHVTGGGLVEAHNAIFEFFIWYYVCHKRGGWPMLNLSQLRCSAAKARQSGLPGSLGKLGEVLNPGETKDKRGIQLIQLLSIPKKPTKKCSELYRSVEKYPELYREMYEYNMQDVRAEQAISSMIPELSPTELQIWQLDQRINSGGVAVDVVGMQNCIKIFRQAEAKYTKELQEITGGAVQTVGEITKRSAGDKWLISRGIDAPSLDKEAIAARLEQQDWTDLEDCRRLLEIRQIIGGASVKKLFAMERTLSADGRLRELFVYCGAGHTGRWCLAEGSSVLIRSKEGAVKYVPIERVSLDDEIWDGIEWVKHDGIVPAGMKEVITHDGVEGTKDHRVLTSPTECDTLLNVKQNNVPIFRGEKPCPITSIE